MEEGVLMAHLFEQFMKPCQMIDRKTSDDEFGGFTTQWVDGAKIRAAIVKDKELEARVAEKEGVKSVYTITTDKNVKLKFHDVIRRLTDGAVFRVTSEGEDGETPEVASFSFNQVNAERWELT